MLSGLYEPEINNVVNTVASELTGLVRLQSTTDGTPCGK